MDKQLFYVRRGPSMQYGPRIPQDVLDMDQVLELRGERNDERLVRLGYVAAVSPNARLVQCGQCGGRFLSEASLTSHGRRRHERSTEEIVADAVRANADTIISQRKAGAVQDVTATVGESEDRKIERQESRINEERPILWENTEAARRAGDAPVVEVTSTPRRKAVKKGARKRPTVRQEATT